MTTHLDTEDLLSLISDLNIGPIRDLGLLDSAAHRPGAMVLGQEAYPGLHLKAAVLLDSLASNHALVDGNKRLGWLAVVVFYRLNDLYLDAPDDHAYDLVISVAEGRIPTESVASMLSDWTVGDG